MTHLASRSCTSSTVSWTSSSRRRPQPTSNPRMARSRLPFKVPGSGSASKSAGLFARQPVPCPGSFGPGARDFGDAGGEIRREQPVVGSLGGQFSDRRQLDIDRGGGQAAAFELGSVSLHGRFGEAALHGDTPGEKAGQHPVVGAAGMGRAHAVEHQALDRSSAAKPEAGQPPFVVLPRPQVSWRRLPNKLQLHGFARVLLPPKRDQRRLDPMVKGLEPVDAGVASGTEGDQETALVDAGRR